MRFSEAFNIERPAGADWFDTHIDIDSAFYVNPFLLYHDKDPLWVGAQEEVGAYFQTVMDLLRDSRGNEAHSGWKMAKQMLTFKEPKEFALGFAMGSPNGSGIGPGTAAKMCQAIVESGYLDSDDTIIGQLVVLTKGVGVDGVGDIVCNILKHRFIEYTKRCARDVGIPLKRFSLENGRLLSAGRKRENIRAEVPVAQTTSNAVLLVPERFLDELPRIDTEDFYKWVDNSCNEEIRDSFNYELNETLKTLVDKKSVAGLVRCKSNLLPDYVRFKWKDSQPYDMEEDPKLLVGWDTESVSIASSLNLQLATPQNEAEFKKWLLRLAEEFKHSVEDRGEWKLLWNDKNGGPRDEKIVQMLARSTWRHYCDAHNINLGKEHDTGRGYVDFDFSRGIAMRGLLEVKLMSSSGLARGVRSQLSQYLKSERILFGVYLCVGFNDRDLSERNVELVTEICQELGKEKGIRIEPVFVDARPKSSASKI